MKMFRWLITAVIVLALLGSAYHIVEQRNRPFFTAGQESSSSMPMH